MKTPDEIKKGSEWIRVVINAMPFVVSKSLEKEEIVKLLASQIVLADEELESVKRELEAQVPKWISVEDEQKPQHHKDVLCRYVFDGDSDCFYAVLTYYAYGDNGYVTGSHFTGEGLHDMRVTHWMPLPEPPEV